MSTERTPMLSACIVIFGGQWHAQLMCDNQTYKLRPLHIRGTGKVDAKWQVEMLNKMIESIEAARTKDRELIQQLLDAAFAVDSDDNCMYYLNGQAIAAAKAAGFLPQTDESK